MNKQAAGSRAASRTALRRRADRKRALIICAVLAAVFVFAMAAALMSVSDNRSYNDYMNRAQQLFYNKDYDGALASLRKASSIEKTEECLMLMADCYQSQGNYAKALEMLRMMDINKPSVASRIDQVETLRRSQGAVDSVRIAGKDYPVNTTRLVLDSMNLGDAVLNEIAQLYAIDSLSLADNTVRDITRLASLGGLVTLNLSGNEIMDLSPLSYLSGLRTLYLDDNPIRDFSPLYSLENLKSLSIKGIDLTESQLSALSKALPNCAIHSEKAQQEIQDISFGGVTFSSDVTDLDLSSMGVWDISALSACQNITRLNLSGNSISDLSPLMNLPYLQWLDISYNAVSDLKPLMGISSLSFLNAAHNNIAGTSALTMMTGLNTLYLDSNPIRDFSGLRKLRSVQILGLAETGLADGDLQYLRGLQTLASLNIKDNPLLTSQGVDLLKGFLPGCMIDHSAFAFNIDFSGQYVPADTYELRMVGQNVSDISTLQMMPQLRLVDLSVNQVTNLYPLYFSECRFTITDMNLSYNGLSDITPLSMLTSIENLDLSFNQITSLQPLMTLTTLRSLRLVGNPVSMDEVNLLCLLLPNCEVII